MLGVSAILKATKKGYKRYGLPGALVAGLGTLIGLRFIKRKLQSRSGDGQSDESDGQSDTTS